MEPSSSMSNKEEPAAASSNSNGSSSSSDGGGSYDCNICLELAQDPVVTMCGHLFCWPCLYRWLVSRSSCKECPVCKSAVEEAKVVPIYGRGKGSTDPRTKGVEIPNRPAGRRTDIPHQHRQNGTGPQAAFQQMGFSFFTGPAAAAQFGNVTLSAGFGLFPFLFGFSTSGFPDLSFGNSVGTGAPGAPNSAPNAASSAQQSQGDISHQNQEALLSRLLLFLGLFVILCLFFF